MHNVEPALRRITGEVKIAVERLYEAIVEAVARLFQWLGEHWRVLALVAAAVVAGILTWMAAQQVLADVDMAQFAKLAAGGFFGVAAVKEDRRAALEELRRAVEKVRVLEGLANRHSPLFGEWRSPEGAREAGKALIDKAVAFARFKGLGRGAEGEFVRLSAFKAPRDREAAEGKAVAFDALGDVRVAKAAGEAASAIRRVVEEAWVSVRPVMAIASRALTRAVPTPETVGLADDEFKRAFNVTGRPLYFVYSVGDVEFGAVRARGLRAVAFLSGAKTLRIEVLAEGVERLAAEVEKVKALSREWVRLATFEVNVESGIFKLAPRVEASAQVKVDVGETERRVLAKWLSALALTDAGGGGVYLGSPDPTLHLFYALAVRETEVRVERVVFTETGPVLHLLSTASTEHVNWLYEDVRRELEKLGVKVEVWKIRQWAKSAAVETIGEYAGEVKRVAREARGVEELRVRLVKLFDDVAKRVAEEYRRTGSKEALHRAVGAVVAKKFFAENVDDPVWWTLLLLGDGVVRVRDHVIGFSAKPVEAAEAVMHVFARMMDVPLEVRRVGKSAAVLSREASRAAVEELFKRLEEAKVGGASASQLLTAVAEWWLRVGTGGSDQPKPISLFALRELAAGREVRWLGAWLSYEAVVTPVPEGVEKWLEGIYRVSVEPPRDVLRGAVGFDAYFERGGERYKLHTDFTDFYLYCESCGEAARGVLTAAARTLGVEKPRWDKNALVLPAEVGWPMFLRLFERYNMSLRVEEGGRELLRVEVLEARADGTAKFRLWYHKWRETRPHQPYVDVEITYDEKWRGFAGYVYANEAKGILREHLAEIAQLLRNEDIEGVSLVAHGKQLRFSGAFRDSVLANVGVKPELPPGEPPAVQHLGGLKFKINDREVEFSRGYVKGGYEFYAELKFSTREETERFASSLKAIDIDARVAGNAVRLDSDSFFGLLAATDATLPGLTLLYCSEEGDFRVYAAVEGGRMRFYFAVKHEGVWRAVEGLYEERGKAVELWRKERDVLEAVRGAVAKALKKLAPDWQSHPAVGVPEEIKDKEDKVKAYYLYLHGPHLKPFLERAADSVEAKPADVALESGRVVVKAGDAETEVEFKLLKGSEAVFLLPQDMERTLALYKSLRALGVPVEIAPKGIKIDREAMWALVATAVEKGKPSGLPAEVMPGVELLKMYSASGVEMYIFRAEGAHYYFAVKTEQEWRAAGGKHVGTQMQIKGKAAPIIADAVNAIYREIGVERKVEVKYDKRYGTPYIKLTNVDLELLGLAQP